MVPERIRLLAGLDDDDDDYEHTLNWVRTKEGEGSFPPRPAEEEDNFSGPEEGGLLRSRVELSTPREMYCPPTSDLWYAYYYYEGLRKPLTDEVV